MDEIKNLTDLSKIIDLCRKKGVESIEIQGIKLTLRSEVPPSNYKKKKEEVPEIVEEPFTDDQALFWSSTSVEEMQ